MSADAAEGLLAQDRSGAEGWIDSPAFDLSFFILSPLLGLALLLISPSSGATILAMAAAGLIGGPHYLATFSFYFLDDTADHQRRRWIAYFVVPVLIVLGVGIVALFHIPAIIPVVIYLWNAYHVSRQSCGILSIYRRRAGCLDMRHRSVTNAAILSTNFAMALAHIDWYPTLNDFLLAISSWLPWLLQQASALAAVLSLAALGISLAQRYRNGAPLGLPELGFLATSLLLFHPYLWVHDSNLATLGMLIGHFLQYLGIVWLLNNRKLAAATGSFGQRCLSRLWRDPWIFFPALLTGGGLFLLVQINFMAVTIAVVLLHFYLDGLFWAFKRPEIRRAISPYLTQGRHRPAAARAGASIADIKPAH
jgi:hypothetical protein